MRGWWRYFLLGSLLLTPACAHVEHKDQVQEPGDKFYKSPYVRRCLQYEKEKLVNEAQSCWSRLLGRIEGEPGFLAKSELSAADVSRVRHQLRASSQRSADLKSKLRGCIEIANRTRPERIRCFQDYLSRHGNQLTRSERFEIESAIATLQRAQLRAEGKIENTLEHAGKLLGLELSSEKEGLRIDTVSGVPASNTGLREQGLIVAMDDTLVAELEETERVSRLESCSDDPLQLLVRYGGMEHIGFMRVQLACTPGQPSRKLWEVSLPEESCSEKDDAELALGLSWCYLARDGILEVEEVCAHSPAARAGIRPGQRYRAVNGTRLLGLTRLQIAELLKTFPAQPLRLQAVEGVLQSPQPVSGPALEGSARAACWQAISATLERGRR